MFKITVYHRKVCFTRFETLSFHFGLYAGPAPSLAICKNRCLAKHTELLEAQSHYQGFNEGYCRLFTD